MFGKQPAMSKMLFQFSYQQSENLTQLTGTSGEGDHFSIYNLFISHFSSITLKTVYIGFPSQEGMNAFRFCSRTLFAPYPVLI